MDVKIVDINCPNLLIAFLCYFPMIFRRTTLKNWSKYFAHSRKGIYDL